MGRSPQTLRPDETPRNARSGPEVNRSATDRSPSWRSRLARPQRQPHCEPWDKGKIVGQKAPLKLKDIWALRVRLQMASRVRELALFNLGMDSKLRGCDLVKIRDVCHGDQVAASDHHAAEDAEAGSVRDHATYAQHAPSIDQASPTPVR
jgi:hypothetical protein